MSAFYVQQADQIFPIYGVSSLAEAREYVLENQHDFIVETDEDVYMNVQTGSVDFASGWDDLFDVVMVRYDADSEAWIEADE